MRVSSPIGELPFEAKRLRVVGREVHITGEMGAWPAKVVIDASDLHSLLKISALPLTALLVLFGLVVVAFRFFIS